MHFHLKGIMLRHYGFHSVFLYNLGLEVAQRSLTRPHPLVNHLAPQLTLTLHKSSIFFNYSLHNFY